MQSFFQEVFEYQRQANQLVIPLLVQLAERRSLHRARQVMSHVLNAHAIWNARIVGAARPFEVWQEHPVQNYESLDQENLRATLNLIQECPLDSMIDYQTGAGKAYQNSVGDIFFHISNHTTHHRAHLIQYLRQEGVEVPMTDYIFLKRPQL